MLIMLGMNSSLKVVFFTFLMSPQQLPVNFIDLVFLVYAAQNNYGAVIALWAPVLMVRMLYFVVILTYIHFSFVRDKFFSVNISGYILNAGLFHGHSNLVFHLFNYLRWCYWSLRSSRRGYCQYFIFIYPWRSCQLAILLTFFTFENMYA